MRPSFAAKCSYLYSITDVHYDKTLLVRRLTLLMVTTASVKFSGGSRGRGLRVGYINVTQR